MTFTRCAGWMMAMMLGACGGTDLEEPGSTDQPLAANSRDSVIRTFAPHVHLHPDDPYRPGNVDFYLARVRMRYHHAGCPDHQILDVGAVNQRTLIAQEHYDNKSFCRHDGGDLRRSDSSENFFLEVVDSSTYRGAPRDEWKPYVQWLERDDGSVEIKYWLFYPFNNNMAIIDHESDWEQVRVLVDLSDAARPKLTEVSLSQHHGGQQFRAGSPDLVLDEGTHPVVYSAKGSHANYAKPGVYPIDGTGGIARDDAKAARPADVWRTERNFVEIGTRDAPANGQVFIKYWGHWGQLGDLPETDGILRHFP